MNFRRLTAQKTGRDSVRSPASGWFGAGPAHRAAALTVLGLAWAGWLLAGVGLSPAGAGWIVAEAGGLGLLVRALAAPAERAPVALVFTLALMAYTLEIQFVQSLPLWSDDFPDSRRYHLNALALVRHWQGQGVPAEVFMLRGLQALGIAEWQPEDNRPYGVVLGMSRYLYQLWLALAYLLTGASRSAALFGNVPFLATAAAGGFLLARSLFRIAGTAWLAVVLMGLDLNFAVWGSVLLREALLMAAMVLALLGAVRLLRGNDGARGSLVLTAGALGVLALVRFNAVGMLLAASALAAVRRLNGWQVVKGGAALAGAALLAAGLFHRLPAPLVAALESSVPGQIVSENLRIAEAAGLSLNAAAGGAEAPGTHVDDVRRAWHRELRQQPLWLSGLKAVTRSLFGPYPWVPLIHGIAPGDFYALMYPGMTLWLLCFPAFLYALARLPWWRDPALRLCATWYLGVVTVYVIGYGQFGGRERMMAQPLLWIVAAQGALLLRDRWRAGRTAPP